MGRKTGWEGGNAQDVVHHHIEPVVLWTKLAYGRVVAGHQHHLLMPEPHYG